jgi:hypothetical protein
MKTAERTGVGPLALLVVTISASFGTVARAEPVPGASAFGAMSCRADESSIGDLGAHLPAKSLARSGQSSAVHKVQSTAQVTRNDRADVTFEVRPATGGAVEVSGQSGELRVKKTVQANGDTVLELSTPKDRVTFTVTGQLTSVARGGTTVELSRTASSSDGPDRIRRLLADSKVMPRFRAVTAALIDAEDRSPASLAFIASDAVAGLLTGDVGAPRRIARFMAAPGLSKVRRAAMVIDCFTLMEQRMADAWVDYVGCVASVLGMSYWQDLCAYRWVIQSESYWFSFIGCSGFNF